jgi:hypothetical protein
MINPTVLGLDKLVSDLGLNIAGNLLYDKLKEVFSNSEKISTEELKNSLVSYLNIENANIVADKMIRFLAERGDIDINGSEIFAKKSILYSSGQNTSFSLENSNSFTDKTGVILNNGKIIGTNGGGMRQNEDSSISFRA